MFKFLFLNQSAYLKTMALSLIKIETIKYNENNYYTNLIILCYNYIKNYIRVLLKDLN